MGRLTYDVEPGGLSEEDHRKIVEYAERGWKQTRIARQLRKHPGTVYWYMIKQGLAVPKYRRSQPYKRGDRTVTPFSKKEDAFILALRVQDFGPKKIAELTNKRFNNSRSSHGVAVRLVMLAAMDEAA